MDVLRLELGCIQMGANDDASFRVQVRTLEHALQEDFDPDRRLHGWAREGMSMDRDDFIDLAHVSKQVPGKTSAQVSGMSSTLSPCRH